MRKGYSTPAGSIYDARKGVSRISGGNELRRFGIALHSSEVHSAEDSQGVSVFRILEARDSKLRLGIVTHSR